MKGSFPGPPAPGLGPVMYPPASGAGADRRQDLQPEVFILQLVDSSAWGMNEPNENSPIQHFEWLPR